MTPIDPLSERIPDNLLREPLVFVFADHVRQGVLCKAIENLLAFSDNPGEMDGGLRDRAETVLTYLKYELPSHIADEENDILPLLRERTRPEDAFKDILRRIGRDHIEDNRRSQALIGGLEELVEGKGPEDPAAFSGTARLFAESHCNHLKWENEVLLPLAGKRLNENDLREISRSMAARRDLSVPE